MACQSYSSGNPLRRILEAGHVREHHRGAAARTSSGSADVVRSSLSAQARAATASLR
jgi:hypothetical protein